MISTQSPLQIYLDLDGTPLDDGYIYFGTVGGNPITSPFTVYWDAAGTQPAAQPIRTSKGVVVRNGSRANVFAGAPYSILIRDRNQSLVHYEPDSTNLDVAITVLNEISASSGSLSIGDISNLPGAAASTQQQINREWVSVFRFMTAAQIADIVSKTGALDCAAACATAFASGHKLLRMPEGAYRWASAVSRPVGVSVIGDGIGRTNINCVTANASGMTAAAGARAYEYVGGFTITGAGAGTNTSIGVTSGDTTHGADYCVLENVESTNFGDANIRLINWIRGKADNLYAHGDPTGVLPAANYGLHLKGTYAFAGSNYDNRIGYVEAYNNVQDIVVENGGKNNFDRPYCYNQNYTGTVHHIHELNSSLNTWNKPHIEPLSTAAGGTALWLIESAAANPYSYMLGPVIRDLEYENGTLGTTVDVIQIGTNGGGLTVYGTRIENGKCMPVSAGKYHVNLVNENSTSINWSTARNNNVPFDRIIRELTINNPNAATNGSYIGSPYEQSYGTWVPAIKAGGASLGTFTAAKADWVRSGKMASVWLDATLSAKTGNAGAVTITGCEAISPNAGTTIFAPKTGGAVVVNCLVVGLATAYPVYAYFNPATGFISFYNTALTTLLTDTSFANGTEVILFFQFEIA